MCEGFTLKGTKCKNAKHPYCSYHMPKDVEEKCDNTPKQLINSNIDCEADFHGIVKSFVDFQRAEIDTERDKHDLLIDNTVHNIETTTSNIECFKQSKNRGAILGEFISKNIGNIVIANSRVNNDDNELILIDHDFLLQITLSMSILMARDKNNKAKSQKSFKSEYVQATERISELKKQLKQKNIEIDELRRVKKEKKEIKQLKKELDETRIILLKKQIEELDNANADPPEYSAQICE